MRLLGLTALTICLIAGTERVGAQQQDAGGAAATATGVQGTAVTQGDAADDSSEELKAELLKDELRQAQAISKALEQRLKVALVETQREKDLLAARTQQLELSMKEAEDSQAEMLAKIEELSAALKAREAETQELKARLADVLAQKALSDAVAVKAQEEAERGRQQAEVMAEQIRANQRRAQEGVAQDLQRDIEALSRRYVEAERMLNERGLNDLANQAARMRSVAQTVLERKSGSPNAPDQERALKILREATRELDRRIAAAIGDGEARTHRESEHQPHSNDDLTHRIEQTKQRLRDVIEQGAMAEREGRREEAAELRSRAHELYRQLRDMTNQAEQAQGDHEHGDHAHDDHAHDDHEHGDHEHGDHAHDDHAHDDHAHDDHEHGDHEHGDHEHGDHEHGDHEHGDHAHDDHEHGDHAHGHSEERHYGPEMHQRIEQLHQAAENLERLDRPEIAEQFRREAEHIERAMHEQRQHQGHHEGNGQLPVNQRIEHLRRAAESLERVGRHDFAERIRHEIGELEHQQRRDYGQHNADHDRDGLPREAIEQFARLHHEIIELREQVQQLQELIERRLR